MIELQDIEVMYGSVCGLRIEGTHRFPEGAVIAVLGSNGAGKTTLINAVLGEVGHTGSVKGIDPRHTSVQFQINSYNSLMRVDELCKLVGSRIETSPLAGSFRIAPLAKKRMGGLSGGERQRVTLFLVLSQDEPTYVFDELTTGLDFQTRDSLMELVRERTAGRTVLITTHYFEEVEGWATHCLILHEGGLLFSGAIDEFLGRRPHYSLLKVRGGNLLDEDLLKESQPMPWDSTERYFVAKDAADQADMAQRLSRCQVAFDVQPQGLYSAYTLALSALHEKREDAL